MKNLGSLIYKTQRLVSENKCVFMVVVMAMCCVFWPATRCFTHYFWSVDYTENGQKMVTLRRKSNCSPFKLFKQVFPSFFVTNRKNKLGPQAFLVLHHKNEECSDTFSPPPVDSWGKCAKKWFPPANGMGSTR